MIVSKKYVLVALVICLSNLIIAKELPKSIEIPVELSKNDQKKLDRANENIKSARELWNQLNTQYNPEGVTNHKIDSAYNVDAMPILKKAASLFDEGNSSIYEVYHKNCVDFWSKHKYDFPSGLDNAKRFQKEAINYVQKAQLNRRVAENYDHEYVKAYDRFYEAISLEIIAAKKEGRAYQIYADWPVHYAYQFDDDIEKDLFNPKLAAVVTPVKKEEKKEDPIVEQPKPKDAEPETLDPTVIYFSVQIAAHTVQMSDKTIHESIYKGTMRVTEIKENGWFKYLLGHYKKYEDAVKLLNEVKVDKAFVVAYKNGKRVPLNEVNTPK